jgi:hypothetical protein
MRQVSIERSRQLSPPGARGHSRLFSVSLFAGENLADLTLEKSDMGQFIFKNRREIGAEIGQEERKLQPERFITEQLNGKYRPLSGYGRKPSALMRLMAEYGLKLFKMPLLVFFMPL